MDLLVNSSVTPTNESTSSQTTVVTTGNADFWQALETMLPVPEASAADQQNPDQQLEEDRQNQKRQVDDFRDYLAYLSTQQKYYHRSGYDTISAFQAQLLGILDAL